MNSDFPRIMTLLRKERGIRQKQAAMELGVSQALLSHYEKGIRECGLDFVVKIADYYQVSCDYLLGRTVERTGYSDSLDKTVAAAKDTQRKATDYANQTVAGAQAEAQNIIQMAQAQAAQLVEENEITQRAQARAAEINDDAMQACNRMQQDTVARLARLLEDADGGLATQLDAVRTMRQQLQMGGYADSDQGGYGPVEYGE